MQGSEESALLLKAAFSVIRSSKVTLESRPANRRRENGRVVRRFGMTSGYWPGPEAVERQTLTDRGQRGRP